MVLNRRHRTLRHRLQLWRAKLDYKWQAHDQKIEIEKLRARVEALQAENERTRSGPFGLSSSAASSGEIKKWFGAC